jgi:hypothetical protein
MLSTILLLFLMYFAPSIVACVKQHPRRYGIYLINLFIGWTLLGWLFALFLSLLD